MGFVINFHTSAKTSVSPRSSSQIHRFSFQTSKPPRNFNVHPLSPQPVVYLNCSFLESSTRVLQRFNLSCRNRSSDDSNELHFESVLNSSQDACFDEQKSDGTKNSNPVSRSSVDKSFRSAAWIGAATVASKILGLLREIILAAIFGVGPVVTAYKYASVLPGFCASLLGGVNGPIHITMATTLSKLPEERGRKLIQNTISVMFLIGGVLGALVFIFAESIIYFSAPGLWILTGGQITREIAISQLKLMIPCIVFAGPVGLGFGCLSAEGDSIFACISPALSSICIIASSITYVWMRGSNAFSPHDALIGGVFVSIGASFGAFLQWLIQVIKHGKIRYYSFSLSWLDLLKDGDVHKFFILMLPAILISGMAQIASFTDLYFASFIPGAAAGLSYAHLLAMAPLGIISSITILPLVPIFSKLTKPSSWPILMENLKKAILLCMVFVLPITMTMCVLAQPVVSVLFQRFTFGSAATSLISSLIFCYSIGSPFYVIRELLVMVFYALGDGQQPFLISVAAIILNAFLDWLFVSRFFLGAQGLALATSFCTASSVLLLLHLLSKKLTGLIDFTAAIGPLFQLLACCIISCTTTSVSYMMLRYLLSSVTIPRYFRVMEILSISLASSLGLCGFFFPLAFLRFPGTNLVSDLIKNFVNKMLLK